MIGVEVDHDVVGAGRLNQARRVRPGVAEIRFVSVHRLDPESNAFWARVAPEFRQNLGAFFQLVCCWRGFGQGSKVTVKTPEQLLSSEVRNTIYSRFQELERPFWIKGQVGLFREAQGADRGDFILGERPGNSARIKFIGPQNRDFKMVKPKFCSFGDNLRSDLVIPKPVQGESVDSVSRHGWRECQLKAVSVSAEAVSMR